MKYSFYLLGNLLITNRNSKEDNRKRWWEPSGLSGKGSEMSLKCAENCTEFSGEIRVKIDSLNFWL